MAGEIQLNSITVATESSGSITAELDTIRPNTTNGSLTLQGDSSNSGVTGLTIDSSGNTALGGVLKLKSSGNSITASNGSTSLISESSGTVTLNNVTLGSGVSGIGQLIGFSFSNAANVNGNVVTLESNKTYDAFLFQYSVNEIYYLNDLAFATVDSSGNVTVGKYTGFASNILLESLAANQVHIRAYTNSNFGYSRALIFERGSTFDAS